MKKIFLFCFLVIFNSCVFAAPFNKIIFFGDSLSDNGNLYSTSMKIIPKSPPYYKGRFSNGPTWAEEVGKYFYDSQYVDYKIYAVGGATALFRLPTSKFFPPSNLELQLNQYLVDATFTDKSKPLYAIWIGSNDYLYYGNSDNADTLTDNIVAKISASVERLVSYGAKSFLILNLPDPSKTPHAKANGTADRVKFLAEKHNKKLAEAMSKLEATYPHVKIVFLDVFSIFNDVVANPLKYNEKYHVNISNTLDACWNGNYYYRRNISTPRLRTEIEQALRAQGKNVNEYDVDAMTNMIMESPALLTAYQTGLGKETGTMTPCRNANEYLFWDTLHPSAIVHSILAKIVVDTLSENSLLPATA